MLDPMLFRDHKYSYNGRVYYPVERTMPSRYFSYWDQKLDIKLESFPRDLDYALFEVKDNILVLKEASFEQYSYPEDEKTFLELGYSYRFLKPKVRLLDSILGSNKKNESDNGPKIFTDMDIRIHFTGGIVLVDHFEKQFILKDPVIDSHRRELTYQKIIELTFEDGRLVNEERYSAAVEISKYVGRKGVCV